MKELRVSVGADVNIGCELDDDFHLMGFGDFMERIARPVFQQVFYAEWEKANPDAEFAKFQEWRAQISK